jgi:hypothetical protein
MTVTGVPPYVIVAAACAAADEIVSRIRGGGWSVLHGWSLSSRPWNARPRGVVCVGPLRARSDAEAALLAAARGAGIVAVAYADQDLVERFYEDLSRFGRVEFRARDPAPDPVEALGVDQRRLLELLAAGMSVGDSARAIFVSRRTADRRLAAARRTIGVGTTAEAVAVYSSGSTHRSAGRAG